MKDLVGLNTSEKLRSAIIAECNKRDKKEGVNIYRIGIMLEALIFAESYSGGLANGINRAFTGSLRNKLLRAIGEAPTKYKESTSWTR